MVLSVREPRAGGSGSLALETPPEAPETLAWALLDPLGRLESLGPWSMVLGPWSLVLGPWSLIPGSLVPGPPGTMCLDFRTLFCHE